MVRLLLRALQVTVLLGSFVGHAEAKVLFDWKADAKHIDQRTMTAGAGPKGTLAEDPVLDAEGLLEFHANQHVEFPEASANKIPREGFSVEATVRIDQPQQWGSIIAHSQDNGNYERGWILGYNGDRFSFRLSTGGALAGATSSSPFSPGQWAHVIGVFDGKTARLYIDGTLASSNALPGKVVRPDIPTSFVLGAYKDKDEFFPMQGRIKQVRIHDSVLAPGEIAKLGPQAFPFTVRPAVRFLGPSTAEVTWESSEPGRGLVAFGTTRKLDRSAESDGDATTHRVVLDDLLPGSTYHYRIAARTPDGLRSGKIATFDTTLNEVPPDLSARIPPAGDAALRTHAAEAVERAGFARGFGLVLQDVALFPTLTVREQLSFGPKLHRWPADETRARVTELAEALDITSLLGRHPQGLSGGEARRVALGRALALRPRLLCLDEALTGLDETLHAEILPVIRNMIRHEGVTALHVTHSSTEAAAIADRVVRMEG